MNNFDKYKNWFYRYTDQMRIGLKYNPVNYDIKIKHTEEVLENASLILKSIKSDDDTYVTGMLAALFHDVGRFSQYVRFGTFKDAQSIDHGILGVEVLMENNVLDDLSLRNREIIYKTVEYHNNHIIPSGLDNDLLVILNMVRDADKIDIFRVVTEQNQMDKSDRTVMLGLNEADGISDEIFKTIKERKSIKYTDLKTADDFRALQLGWVFDINYQKSIEMIRERHHIDSIFNYMHKSNRSNEIYNMVLDYMDEMYKGNN